LNRLRHWKINYGFTKLVVITTRTSHQQLESNLFIALNTEEKKLMLVY